MRRRPISRRSFVLTEGAALTQRMLLFPNGDKVFDGTTDAVADGIQHDAPLRAFRPASRWSPAPARPPRSTTADRDRRRHHLCGYTLGGPNADQYALAGSCCVSTFRTTARSRRPRRRHRRLRRRRHRLRRRRQGQRRRLADANADAEPDAAAADPDPAADRVRALYCRISRRAAADGDRQRAHRAAGGGGAGAAAGPADASAGGVREEEVRKARIPVPRARKQARN